MAKKGRDVEPRRGMQGDGQGDGEQGQGQGVYEGTPGEQSRGGSQDPSRRGTYPGTPGELSGQGTFVPDRQAKRLTEDLVESMPASGSVGSSSPASGSKDRSNR